MYIDADENLYMPVKNSHVVLKYDPKGNLLMTMGEWDKPSDTGWSGRYSDVVERAAGPFNSPSDIAIHPNGDLYISDGYGNARVHRFTSDGQHVESWGQPGKTGHGEFHVPHGVWVHTDGGSSSLTARTTASRFSTTAATSWSSGSASPAPATST